MEQTLACNANWLDNNTATTTVSGCFDSGSNNLYWTGWTYPVYYPTPSRPIKLGMSEVDYLRRLARSDDKLKSILKKFTDQIEITVDFG